MADQNSILHILVASSEPLTLDEVCSRAAPGEDCRPQMPARKRIIECLGRLMAGGYAVSHRVFHAPKSLSHAGGGKAGSSSTWEATPKGRALVAAEGIITRARPGPRNCRRDPVPNSMKQRLWTALRLKGKATLGDLAELVHRAGDPADVKVIENARAFLRGLCRAGIAVPMQKRVPSALSARGAIRYSLLRDLGPFAPVCGRHDVFDPNARARIPYREETHA